MWWSSANKRRRRWPVPLHFSKFSFYQSHFFFVAALAFSSTWQLLVVDFVCVNSKNFICVNSEDFICVNSGFYLCELQIRNIIFVKHISDVVKVACFTSVLACFDNSALPVDSAPHLHVHLRNQTSLLSSCTLLLLLLLIPSFWAVYFWQPNAILMKGIVVIGFRAVRHLPPKGCNETIFLHVCWANGLLTPLFSSGAGHYAMWFRWV